MSLGIAGILSDLALVISSLRILCLGAETVVVEVSKLEL
jgi:hypothetical protein